MKLKSINNPQVKVIGMAVAGVALFVTGDVVSGMSFLVDALPKLFSFGA